MKALLTWALVFLAVQMVLPQSLLCNEIPIEYKSDSISFGKSNADGPGDSMMVIPIVNLSDTSFYEPSAKLRAVTVLPAGTSIVNEADFISFTPVFKPGQTAYARFYFKVDSMIPPEFTTTFQLWLSDRVKAAFDSCEFDTTFTLNLNPQVIPEVGLENANTSVHIYPVPAGNVLHISFVGKERTNSLISIMDMDGKKVMEQMAEEDDWDMDVSRLTAGVYFIEISGYPNSLYTGKIEIQR